MKRIQNRSVFSSSDMFRYIRYGCGCRYVAEKGEDIPKYCPEHGKLVNYCVNKGLPKGECFEVDERNFL